MQRKILKSKQKFITHQLLEHNISQLSSGSQYYSIYFRIFSHPNILPVIGCCTAPPRLVVISQDMPNGSLYSLLHKGGGVVVDSAQALRFAVDVARGMAYLHSLDRIVPQYQLNSRHVMVNIFNNLICDNDLFENVF